MTSNEKRKTKFFFFDDHRRPLHSEERSTYTRINLMMMVRVKRPESPEGINCCDYQSVSTIYPKYSIRIPWPHDGGFLFNKSSQVVGLRDRVAIIRTLIFSSPHLSLTRALALVGISVGQPATGTVTGPATGTLPCS